jgi:hypothetical protein
MGGTGPGPTTGQPASSAPAIGVPQVDTIGAPLTPSRSAPRGGSGVMGGSGPASGSRQ